MRYLNILFLLFLFAGAAFGQADQQILSATDSPDPVTPGNNITYTIQVSNNGPNPAVNGGINAVLDSNLTYVSATAPAGFTCNTSGNNVSCTHPSFPSGSTATITIVAQLPASLANSPDGTVTSNFSTSGLTSDPVPGNNFANVTTSYDTAQIDLAVSVTDSPDPVTPDGNITYTVTVSNAGPDTATSVNFNAFNNGTLRYQSSTTPSGFSCNSLPAVGATATFTCQAPSLASGYLGQFTVVVKADANVIGINDTTLQQSFSIGGTGDDTDQDNNSETETTAYVTPDADMAVTVTDAPDPVLPGAPLTYTLTIANNGPDTAPNATLSAALSTGTTFTSLSAPSGWSCITPAVGAHGTVTCSIASLANGGTANFTLIVMVSPAVTGGTVLSTAVAASSAISDPNGGNNGETETTSVTCPAPTLNALPNGTVNTPYTQAVVASGGSGSYTYAVTAGSVPTGLTLNANGTWSGTPTATGTYNFTVTATDTVTACAGSRSYSVTIGSQVSAGQVIISEFRFRGPDPDGGGPLTAAANEFIEFYNNTDADITVSSGDTSAGWALLASDAQVRFIIPNGTVIPARGYFLAVNSNGYGLSDYPSGHNGVAPTTATGDPVLLPDGVTQAAGYQLDIPDGAGITLFRTANTDDSAALAASRMDAVGFAGVGSPYYETTPLQPAGGITADIEHSFYRKLQTGLPQDTNDNSQDFQLVAPSPAGLANAALGAPGPQNLASPIQRNAGFVVRLIDATAASSSAPNRNRDTETVANGGQGTLSIRRRLSNNTGQSVTRLRFRIVDMTTVNSPLILAPQAILRALSSGQITVISSDPAVCGADPTPCSLTLEGTTVEEPPAQSQGGGLNTSMVVTLPAPLAPGATLDLHWLLGVEANGYFRFFVNIEAVTSSAAR